MIDNVCDLMGKGSEYVDLLVKKHYVHIERRKSSWGRDLLLSLRSLYHWFLIYWVAKGHLGIVVDDILSTIYNFQKRKNDCSSRLF